MIFKKKYTSSIINATHASQSHVLFLIIAYNTYKYTGLPPTAISNPGLDAINAAIRPTDTKYLYFLNQRVSLFIGEMREFKETTIRSFDRIRDDMNTLKEDVNEKFDDIKKELKLIAEKIK